MADEGQLPPHGTEEREEIEEIRAWLFEPGYKMGLTCHEPDVWSAPLMRVDVKTGVAPYATGPTPMDAARRRDSCTSTRLSRGRLTSGPLIRRAQDEPPSSFLR
jgi:hypothetical protein